ncbi:hypothetical protein Q1695_008700 [Nippostrongylus brasiliensis]|nr:hypothetical protein Q1695_008700 [Nippostrongylus brasiliensis]
MTKSWKPVLLVLFTLVPLVHGKPKVLDILNGDGERNIEPPRDVASSDYFGRMRNALANDEDKWVLKDSEGNTIIPYTFGRYDDTLKDVIREAMKRIEKNTCIRFKRRTDEADYIHFKNVEGEGCHSKIGRFPGENVVVLEHSFTSTCMEPHLVQHELFHVIGLWHEQARRDRDDYITVNYNNVKDGQNHQFNKVKVGLSTTFDIPYDYRSLMHYGPSAFAKPGTIAIETKDKSYQSVIGTATDASPSDYRKVCLMYKCAKCM